MANGKGRYTAKECARYDLQTRTRLYASGIIAVGIEKAGRERPYFQFSLKESRQIVWFVYVCHSQREFRPSLGRIEKAPELLESVGLYYKPEDAMWYQYMWHEPFTFYDSNGSAGEGFTGDSQLSDWSDVP